MLTAAEGGQQLFGARLFCSGTLSTLTSIPLILQSSNLDVSGLTEGEHYFQCCIRPWMRVQVDVK